MYVWSRRTHWPTAPICCCIYNLWTFCLSWLFYIPVPPAPVTGPPLHSWPGISLLLPVFKELRTFGRTQCSQVGRRKPESVIISRQLLIYWSKPCLSECLQLSLLWVALNRHTRFPPRDLFTQAQSSEQRAPSRKAQSTDSQVIPGANARRQACSCSRLQKWIWSLERTHSLFDSWMKFKKCRCSTIPETKPNSRASAFACRCVEVYTGEMRATRPGRAARLLHMDHLTSMSLCWRLPHSFSLCDFQIKRKINIPTESKGKEKTILHSMLDFPDKNGFVKQIEKTTHNSIIFILRCFCWETRALRARLTVREGDASLDTSSPQLGARHRCAFCQTCVPRGACSGSSACQWRPHSKEGCRVTSVELHSFSSVAF